MAKAIMIQGTASNAGKSLLAAGLCRIFHQDGYRVAPFKSQNMALNSFITADGLEMGRAQVVQAEAAGVAPDVRMNPVLLKPTNDTGSQVIVNGVPRGTMGAVAYFKYKKALIPEIMAAFESLSAENDIIVIEGAGSPAEINLRQDDFVNMGMARLAGAPVLLAGDIDRGGVFASLYGTVKLLEPEERARIKGLLINKFRGDVEILRPGLVTLEELTGKPVLGVVPMLDVDVDDEDSFLVKFKSGASGSIEATRNAWGRNNFITVELHGTLGSVYFNYERLNELQVCWAKDPDDRRGFKTIYTGPAHFYGDATWNIPGMNIGYGELKAIEMFDFISAIVTGQQPSTRFEVGYRVERVCAAVAKSAESRQWEKVED